MRALAIWYMVSLGELVDEKEQKVNWSIDWGAFREGVAAQHEMFADDDVAELWEAMLVIRSVKMAGASDLMDDPVLVGVMMGGDGR